MFPVIQPEQFVIVGVQGVAVVGIFVIDDFLEVGNRVVPLLVKQVDFPSQCICGSPRGTSEIGIVPFDRQFLYRLGQVVNDMAADFIGRSMA